MAAKSKRLRKNQSNQAKGKRVEEVSSNSKKISGETKESGQEEGPTVCLFVQHFNQELNASMYVIRLPHDISELDQDKMIEVSESDLKPKIISRFEGRSRFMHYPAFVNIGSKIYIFGGATEGVVKDASEVDTLSRRVQVIDINDPKQEIKSVAPMHTPKDMPCVFVHAGMIYAIGTDPLDCTTSLPGRKDTGLFERYIPRTNRWEVLADPPSFNLWRRAELLDCATVIGNRVIIGCPFFHAIFNLKKLTWDYTLSQKPDPYFPFGSVFPSGSASLYHLSGRGVARLSNELFGDSPYRDGVAIKKFSFPNPIKNVDNASLVKHPFSNSRNQQTMAEEKVLNNDIPFTRDSYLPRRYFFHVGGLYFCYVVTANLFDQFDLTQYEPNCRGVLIKFFKEGVDEEDKSRTVFKPVASFTYKFKTTFLNVSAGSRCLVMGTVPDSWTKFPPKKKQGGKPKSVNSDMTSEGEKSEDEVEKAVGNDQPDETRDLEKLLAARDAEISILKAELAAKEELLRTAAASETGQ